MNSGEYTLELNGNNVTASGGIAFYIMGARVTFCDSVGGVTVTATFVAHRKDGYEIVWSHDLSGDMEGFFKKDNDGDGSGWKQDIQAQDHICSDACGTMWSMVTNAACDDWLYFPELELAAGEEYLFTFMARAYYANTTASYRFAVSLDGGDTFVWESELLTVEYGWKEYALDLTEYAGNKVTVVLKHQGTVQGVILDVDCPHLYKKTATEPELTVQFTGASLTAGVDLSMKYYLNIPDDIAEGKTVSMRFTMNGKTTVVTDYVKNGDTYVFSFDKIAPQCMNDSIRAEVLIGDTVVEEHDGYSVRKYAEGVMGYYSADEELMRLVVDLLNYGAASQLYVGYNTDDLANAGITAAGSDDLPAASDVVTVLKTESGVSGNVRILGATVRFDYINKIGIKLSSTENARLLLNGRELVPVDGICYTDGIHATDFDKVFVFELYEGDTLVQTLTYSVTSYVYSQMNKTEDGELTAMAELARALYRYGKSAEAYVDAMGDAA